MIFSPTLDCSADLSIVSRVLGVFTLGVDSSSDLLCSISSNFLEDSSCGFWIILDSLSKSFLKLLSVVFSIVLELLAPSFILSSLCSGFSLSRNSKEIQVKSIAKKTIILQIILLFISYVFLSNF